MSNIQNHIILQEIVNSEIRTMNETLININFFLKEILEKSNNDDDNNIIIDKYCCQHKECCHISSYCCFKVEFLIKCGSISDQYKDQTWEVSKEKFIQDSSVKYDPTQQR